MRTSLFIGLLLAGICTSSEAAVSDWVGAEGCIGCHVEQGKAWQRGPHKGASAGLGANAGPRCQGCHNTGDAPTGVSPLAGVQCEACHGAGRHYAPLDIMRDPVLARALGLRSMATPAERELVCMRCHSASTSLEAFDVEKAWSEIAH